MKKATWDETFMTMCYLMAHRSGDFTTHVGAVIVAPDKSIVSTGYNDLPRGIDDQGELDAVGDPCRRSSIGGAKYQWTEHSERNAIYNAGRNGVPTKGCTLYVNFLPCAPCARAIIQSGIVEVVAHLEGQEAFYETRGENENVWAEDHKMVLQMFADAGQSGTAVNFRWWSGQLIRPMGFFSGIDIEL